MKKNAWTLTYWISISLMGVLGSIWASNRIAAENGGAFLPDTVRISMCIMDMICLVLLVFSRIKSRS